MKRDEKFVLGAEKSLIFEGADLKNEKFIIKKGYITKNVYSKNYINPPIPDGYKHICGEWNNGFVIKRFSDGSQFVWIPVGSLDSNGTLDGEHFSEKFGMRNYQSDESSYREFNGKLKAELFKQHKSVKKYGGFYISRYNISKNLDGNLQSVKGAMPLVNINFYDAKKFASTIENRKEVKSHLTFGAEYDSILEWFIKSKAKTPNEIVNDSTKWGNYWNTENSQKALVKTGSCEKWCTNNIYDFAGNVDEWTQEYKDVLCCAIRGGFYNVLGYSKPVACCRYYFVSDNFYGTGFRAALYIK